MAITNFFYPLLVASLFIGFTSCKKEFGEKVSTASANSVNKLVAGSKPNIILIVADGE
jgi:hypothetical protein